MRLRTPATPGASTPPIFAQGREQQVVLPLTVDQQIAARVALSGLSACAGHGRARRAQPRQRHSVVESPPRAYRCSRRRRAGRNGGGRWRAPSHRETSLDRRWRAPPSGWRRRSPQSQPRRRPRPRYADQPARPSGVACHPLVRAFSITVGAAHPLLGLQPRRASFL